MNMNVFQREMKTNFKSFMIWAVILIGMFSAIFLMYPSIVNSENIEMLDEMMKLFPEDVLKAFNMDISTLDSAYGWLKSEGFVFILLIVGCYSGILGSHILLKEESDKTIEYLNSLPIKRRQIVMSKVIVGIVYIILLVAVVTIFNYLSITVNDDINKTEFFALSMTPLFSGLVIYAVCMFLSTFAHKTKKMLGVSLGIVFVSYIMQVISQLSDKVEFIKYFSVYTLSDVRNVIESASIDPMMVGISIVLIIVCIALTLFHYERKELI